MTKSQVKPKFAGLVEHPLDVAGEEIVAFVNVQVIRTTFRNVGGATQSLQEELTCEQSAKKLGTRFAQAIFRREIDDKNLAIVHDLAQIENAFRLPNDSSNDWRANEAKQSTPSAGEPVFEVFARQRAIIVPVGLIDIVRELFGKRRSYALRVKRVRQFDCFNERKTLYGECIENKL